MVQSSDVARRLGRAAMREWAPPLALLTAGVILPNALSIATALGLIDIGLPLRTFSILLYGLVALLAFVLPWALTGALFLAVLGCDLVWTISVMFGLAPGDLLVALEYAGRINVLASPLYIGLICVIATTTIASLTLLLSRSLVKRGNAYLLCVGMLLTSAVESIANNPNQSQAGARAATRPSQDSAVEQSGLLTEAVGRRRNVVVVMVESLGYLHDADARAAIAAPLDQPRITDRYAVTSGKVPYAGSTTSGEMRELCAASLPYAEVAHDPAHRCLPQMLKDSGYSTRAFHGFSQEMFSRLDWYPRIGFDDSSFFEQLAPKLNGRCGGTFRGVCDVEIAPLIAQRAAQASGPQLIYWLTLNTHVPIAPTDARTNFDCGQPVNKFGRLVVCRMAELWRDVFEAVAELALDPTIGPAEILIVGDHAPPLWSKRDRSQFEPGQVAWYRLTPRDPGIATLAGAARDDVAVNDP